MTRRARIVALGLAVVAALPVSASAADDPGEIRDLRLGQTSVPAGDSVDVTGTFRAAFQSFGNAWFDQTFLFSEVTTPDPDMDLIFGYIQHGRPGDPVSFVAAVRGGGISGEAKAGPAITWPFAIGPDTYMIRMFRDMLANPTAPAWTGSIFRCGEPTCADPTTRLGGVATSFNAANRSVAGSVDLDVLAGPGGVKGPQTITHSSQAPPSSEYRGETGALGATVPVDQADDLFSVPLPVARVRLGVAPAGTPASDVTFSQTATLTLAPLELDVPFAGAVSLAGLAPGSYRVWTEGCFGPCAVSSTPLTIT